MSVWPDRISCEYIGRRGVECKVIDVTDGTILPDVTEVVVRMTRGGRPLRVEVERNFGDIRSYEPPDVRVVVVDVVSTTLRGA